MKSRAPVLPTSQAVKKSIDVKIDDKSLSVNFARYAATTQPNKGVIIFVCGGPGFPCSLSRPHSVPNDYEVVTVDYLGVGMNRQYQKPTQMAIESQADVVAAIARSFRIRLVIQACI